MAFSWVARGFKVDPLGFDVWNEYVVLSAQISGHERASGLDVQTEMTVVWRLRDGKGLWGATYFSREEALIAIKANEDDLTHVR